MTKLTFSMLDTEEKQTYFKMHNLYIKSRDENYVKKSKKAIEKAAHPSSIILQARMLFNLSKSLYYDVRELVSLITGSGMREAEQLRITWTSFFKDVLKKYNCSCIDWTSFPPLPYPFLEKLDYTTDNELSED